MKKSFLTIILAVIFIASFAQKKILFDNTKSETAGNADWIIDDNQSIPSPAQSEITQSTTEDYWQGALSSWGVEMVKRGYYVETLPSTGLITYDNTSNSQDLSNYDIFVVCEPNNPFSSSEKQAMIDFVENGGGLFIVADHAIADRDGDGWDALEVWNDFFSSYSNPFGFTLDAGSNVSKDPATNVANLPTNTILHGEAGDVDGIAFYNGGTFTIDKNANSTVIGLVYYDGYSNTGNTGVMAVCATYGNGRVVGVGDSSVAEDETAHDASHTYPGWSQPLNAGNATGDDGVFITNATIWLGESSTNPSLSASSNSLSGFSYITGNGPSASQSFSISGSNLDGSIITVNAPSNYEISSNNTTFNPTIEISYSAPTLVSTTLYVRLKSGLTNATYNESITVSDNGSASNISISLSGEVSSDVNIISENFTNCPPSNWTIYSVTSNKNWSCNNQAMSINAYNGDVASNDWLISPALDLSAYSSVTLNFDSWTQYSDAGITNPEVKLKYSTNYPGSGNPESYTWTNLSYSFPTENSQSWTSSGDVDLSGISETNIYIAFQYTSSGTGGGTSVWWQVDNINITGQVESNQHTISTSVSPSAAGTTTGTGSYNDGATVTLTATANTGYNFTNWTENGSVVSTNTTYQFTATSNRTLIANFTANSYTVSASVEPTNSGTISGTGSYNYGTTASLTATANTGYTFTNWTENGTVVSTNNTYSFTVDKTRTLVANFTLNTFNITASINLANAGSIGGSGEYNYGATATLTASANNGYTFTNWTENDTQVSTSTTYSFTVTDDRNLIANFEVQTSTPNILSSSVKIYPNPSSGIFTVEIIDNENINHIEITDISGKILQKYKIESSKIPVDISEYYNGIYFIHIISNNGSAVKKIVKQ